MKPIKISVVVPTYNSARYLEECLDSLVAQSLPPDEIIVCDDASSDATRDIVHAWSGRHDRVVLRTVFNDINRGPAANFNSGLRVARGEYLAFIAGDDYWMPEKLEREYARIRRGDVAWVYSRVRLCRVDERGGIAWSAFAGTARGVEGDVFREVVGRELSPRNFLVSRDAIEGVGGFDETIGLYEDWDLKIRLSRSHHVACVPQELVVYRQHGSGEHRAELTRHLGEIAKVLRKARSLSAPADMDITRQAFIRLCPASMATSAGEQSAHRAAVDSLDLPYRPCRPRADGEGLIFLLSMPRSGSTLLQRVLGSHPDVHTVAEPWLMLHPFYALRDRGLEAEYNAPLAHRGLSEFLQQLPGAEENYFDAVRQMATVMYGRAVRASGKSRFLDKTPRYLYIIPELARAFPKARFVILLRNPMAVLASVLGTWFQDRPQELASNSEHYADLTRGPDLLAAGIEALGERALVVRYEDLVDDPGSVVEPLCGRLGLPYYPAMLDYGRHQAPAGTLGDEIQVQHHTRPVAEHRDKWQQRLKDPVLNGFALDYLDTIGTEVLAGLGYDVESIRAGLTDSVPAEGIDTSIGRGEAHFAAGDLEAARTAFESVLARDPGNFDACNNLGVIHWHQGGRQRALEYLLSALEVRPADRHAVINLSRVLFEMDQIDEAHALCKAYLKIHPDDGEVRALLPDEGRPAAAVEMTGKAGHYRVTAVVSSYNSERFMRGRLDNLVGQTLYRRGELEIIVIDSNSPQREAQIVAEYADRYAHIRYLRTDRRETVYGAWNRGYHMACAPYVINANTDDRFDEDALLTMAVALDRDTDIDCVYGNWLVTAIENDSLHSGSHQFLFEYPEFTPLLLLYFQITSHAAMLRRQVVEQIGYFDDGFTIFGDREFMLRFAVSGARARKLDAVVGLYLENPGSLEHAGANGAQEFAAIRQAFVQPEPLARLFGMDAVPPSDELASLYAAAGTMGHRFYARDGHWVSDYAFAAQLLRHALALDPNNQVALNNLAIIAIAGGVSGEANALLSRADAPAGLRHPAVVANRRRMELGENNPGLYQWLSPSPPASRQRPIARFENAPGQPSSPMIAT